MAIRNQYAKFAHSMCLSLSHNMHSRTFTVLLPVAQSRKNEKYVILLTLIVFFFRKTFSPVSDTTLNSIFPEKVAVNDLYKKFS